MIWQDLVVQKGSKHLRHNATWLKVGWRSAELYEQKFLLRASQYWLVLKTPKERAMRARNDETHVEISMNGGRNGTPMATLTMSYMAKNR